MCRETVRKGLALMFVGIVSVTLATFLHGPLARLFFLSVDSETQLTYYGFLLGGASGACGVLVAVAGLVRRSCGERNVSLLPVVLLLLGAIALFFFLSYLSLTSSIPGGAPGESVTI